MIIVVVCSSCGKRYEVPGKLSGRLVRCKQCHSNFRVPVPTEIYPPQSLEKTAKLGNFDDFFDEDTEPEMPSGPAIREARSKPKNAIPDFGASGVLLSVFFVLLVGVALLAFRGSPASPSWAALLFLLVGTFVLVSASANCDSFSRSKRLRVVASIFGEDFAKMLHRVVGLALMMVAVLLYAGVLVWPFKTAAAPAETPLQESKTDTIP